MALGSHLITVRRLEKYINDVIGKKANLPNTNKTIIGNISQINSDLTNNTCVNLLNPTAQTQTVNGVTLTNNGDGTYTVNGTASDKTSFSFARFTNIDILENTKLVGCPVGGTGTTYFMYITCYNGSTWAKAYIDSGNGKIVSEIPSGVNVAWLEMTITKNTTCNNLLFKPMLTTDLNAKYSDYVPYTGVSGRLNEDVAEIYEKVEDNADAISQINSDLTERTTWVFKGSALGSNYISLPSDFSEVHIVVLLGSNDRIVLNVLKNDLLPNQSTYFNDGYYMNNSHYCRVAIQFTSDNKVTLASCFYNSNSNSASNTYFGVKVR